MATIIDKSSGKYFTVDARNLENNSLCYRGDFNQENTRINVLLVCFAVGGFGDIMFGVKFARYLLSAFPTINITILTGDVMKSDLDSQKSKAKFIHNALKEYNNNETSSKENNKGVTYFGNRVVVTSVFYHNTNTYYLNCSRTFHVMYVVPAVGNPQQITLTGTDAYDSYQRLKNNSYNFTEYNRPHPSSAQTGVPYNNQGQLGLLLSTDDKLLPAPPLLDAVINKRPFSLAYFYTEDQTEDFLLKLSQCFLEYFNQLKKMSLVYNSQFLNQNPSGFAILCKYGLINNLADFLETPHHNITPNLRDLGKVLRDKVYKEDGNMIIEMIEYCAMDSKAMFALYQRSLPVVFLSGDQSVTDFISVNQYPDHDIFYQIMSWKKEFAKALGLTTMDMTGSTACGKIPAIHLEKIKNNPRADFRLRGLRLVENTLLFAAQASAWAAYQDEQGYTYYYNSVTKESTYGVPPALATTGCTQYFSSDQLGTQKYAELVTKLKSHQLDLLYNVILDGGNSNLMALTQQHFSDVEVIKKGLLPKMNAVDAGYIYGAAGNISAAKELNKLKNAIYIDWLRGSESTSKGSIHVRLFPYVTNGDNKAAFYGAPSEIKYYNCKNIQVSVKKRYYTTDGTDLTIVYVPRTVAAIMMAGMVNTIFRKQLSLGNHLTYTYASLDTRCLNPLSRPVGMLLFSERAPLSMSFRKFLQNPEICDVGALSSVLLQLFWIIYKLQLLGDVVHNAFDVDSNILVELLGSPRTIVLDNLPHNEKDIWKNEIDHPRGKGSLKLPIRFLVRIQDFTNSRHINPILKDHIFVSETAPKKHLDFSPRKNVEAREHDKKELFRQYKIFKKFPEYSLPYLLSQLVWFCGDYLKKKPKIARYPCTDFLGLFTGKQY